MTLLLIFIPLLAAFIGWLSITMLIKFLFYPIQPVKILGISIQGILPKNQELIGHRIAKIVSEDFLSFDLIEQKVTDPETLQKILPIVDAHIDDFLNNKLKATMPMISMFIGEKTIAQLKTVFMAEIELLFPVLLKNYVQELKGGLDIEKTIVSKISTISIAQSEISFTKNFLRELNTAKFSAAAVGFIIGMIQLLIISLFL